MTIWTKDLIAGRRDKADAIADAIGALVEDGHLLPGQKLPSQRALARRLGVALGTVTAGFRVAQDRGYLVGEHGRGCFVRLAPGHGHEFGKLRPYQRSVIELEDNIPVGIAEVEDAAFADALSLLRRRSSPSRILNADWHSVAHRMDRAAQMSLESLGVSAQPEQILVVHGAQPAFTAIMIGLLSPGDVMLMPTLGPPGLRALAHRIKIEIVTVPCDEQGVIPGELEQAQKRRHAKLLFLEPTLASPTTAIASEQRRRELSDVVLRSGLVVLEYEASGYLLKKHMTPIAAMIPDRCVFVADTMFVLGLGARTTFIRAPSEMVPAIANAVSATSWMPLPLATEIASHWIRSGTIDALRDARRAELKHRNDVVRDLLGHLDLASHPCSHHAWLTLPEPLKSIQVRKEAARGGVLVNDAAWFAGDTRSTPNALRICLGPAADTTELTIGLRCLLKAIGRVGGNEK